MRWVPDRERQGRTQIKWVKKGELRVGQDLSPWMVVTLMANRCRGESLSGIKPLGTTSGGQATCLAWVFCRESPALLCTAVREDLLFAVA